MESSRLPVSRELKAAPQRGERIVLEVDNAGRKRNCFQRLRVSMSQTGLISRLPTT